jgi:rRNA maturation endonuclease Nob1
MTAQKSDSGKSLTGKKEQGKKKSSTPSENIRCRVCFNIDGYLENENVCKHCGARLFRIDAY